MVTCGPTWVPIDPVRVISNRSSGELGHRIAKELKRAGAKVTLIEGPVTDALKAKSIKIIKFNFFADLKKVLRKALQRPWDCIIHAAAVSDYQLSRVFLGKLNSQTPELTLRLIPTEKLIQLIKRIDPKVFLVGFKLEGGNKQSLRREARKLFEEADCDLVVANTSRNAKYSGFIFDKNTKLVKKAQSRTQMAKTLVKVLKKNL